ncbi:MAG TPA: DUF1579 domain-containing protein [Chitinophagaceae bacterium]|nr:DUF1579 domain-containing protein [Chitinophagaceae bacterium]
MRKILLVFAVTALSLPTFAQKSKKQNTKSADKEQALSPVSPTPGEDPNQRRATEQASLIGPMHHYFMEWAGHWREEMKIWPMTPGKSEPVVTILDRTGMPRGEGRFLSCDFRGMMNNRIYEAYATYGYDNVKQKFVKTWYDNTGTGILVLEGDFDAKTNTIDFKGTTMDPLTKEKVNIRQLLTMKDPNNHVLEIFIVTKDGKEIKTMEIVSKRA